MRPAPRALLTPHILVREGAHVWRLKAPWRFSAVRSPGPTEYQIAAIFRADVGDLLCSLDGFQRLYVNDAIERLEAGAKALEETVDLGAFVRPDTAGFRGAPLLDTATLDGVPLQFVMRVNDDRHDGKILMGYRAVVTGAPRHA